MIATLRWTTLAAMAAMFGSASAQVGGVSGAGAAGRGGRGNATAISGRWIGTLECIQCTVHLSPSETWVEFGAEPVVRGITADGGALIDGDVLLAVDGVLITTPAGGRRLSASVTAAQPTRFTIRRNGRQMDVAVPQHIRWSVDSTGRRVFASQSDSVTIVTREARDSVLRAAGWQFAAGSNGVLGWQIGTLGFTDQPVRTATTPEGATALLKRPTAAASDSAVRSLPNPLYLTSRSDTSLNATSIRFINVPTGGTLRLYTTDGTLIRMLANNRESGAAVPWNVRDRNGLLVPGGTYYFNMESAGTSYTGRLVIVDSLRRSSEAGQSPDSTARVNTADMSLNTTRGWLGFALDCLRCTADRIDPSSKIPPVHFTTPPRVVAVEPGPASAAGFKVGDVIRTIDGKQMASPAGATRFSTMQGGERVQFGVERGRQLITLTLVVPKPY